VGATTEVPDSGPLPQGWRPWHYAVGARHESSAGPRRFVGGVAEKWWAERRDRVDPARWLEDSAWSLSSRFRSSSRWLLSPNR